MNKSISRIIGVIMLIVAFVFIMFALNHLEKSFAVDNLTKVFRIKKSDDLELSKGSEGIPHCEAYRCNS